MERHTHEDASFDKIIRNLQEREKELNCLYHVEEILNSAKNINNALESIIGVIPPGWQYPANCQVRIRYLNSEYHSPDFLPSKWVLESPIEIENRPVGDIAVYYTESMPLEHEGPFLKEERKLLDNIADRLGTYIFHEQNKKLMHEWQSAKERMTQNRQGQWQVIIDLLRRTDHELFLYLSRKMTYYLCWNGVKEAQELLRTFGTNQALSQLENGGELNKPSPKIMLNLLNLATKTFDIAAQHINDEDILANVQRWIQESRTNFLVKAVDNNGTSLSEIADALRRFHHIMPDPTGLPPATQKTVNSGLVDRFLTSQLDFIRVAKNYIDVNDMYDILQRTIYSRRSRGRLGGKSSGLLLASRIISKVSPQHKELQNIKIPKTWYLTSDVVLHFMYSNNLEETVEQKYKPREQVRIEYPHIIQIFKNSPFPPDIIKGLSMALDDFGDHPLIVRSSSLLEDRLGAAFSGKYKSLFIANQGNKQERLEALTDAIAEVYASLFASDPIEYRAERGLLDFHEEMAIMIQEVVGTKVGRYFFPSFAGVAFSQNEFRWSPRIKREDGLIRLVPGLGTRAVDRVAADYPVLIAPGQPNLRVNVTIEESVRYAPKKVDVINLETNTFETVAVETLINEYGDEIPAINQMVSVINHDHLTAPGLMTDFANEDVIVTFEQLRKGTPFVKQIHTILHVLEQQMQTPVDIEFASDGKNLYLLQARPQSAFARNEAPPIPTDVPSDNVLFSAKKYVSNGKLQDITHIVYVDPDAYNQLTERAEYFEIARIVGKLNKLLPKRQFILMGPGRWGSRGDIKLGVNVTYSDINNTAALIEIAMQKGNYVPELSFGTHFFQDLVEASIRYLPLYPDANGIVYKHDFFRNSSNVLTHILPEYASFAHVVKVIDVPNSADGRVMRLVMNADQDEALAYLDSPSTTQPIDERRELVSQTINERSSEEHWQWRLHMATQIAAQVDAEKFGIQDFYIIGSTKNATAGPASDIDLLLHVHDVDHQQAMLRAWLDGWSLCLDEMNYRRTGHRTGGLLDVHFVTDEDIAKKTSFALKIGAITDAARKLPMRQK